MAIRDADDSKRITFEVKVRKNGLLCRGTRTGRALQANGNWFYYHVTGFPRRAVLSDQSTGDILASVLAYGGVEKTEARLRKKFARTTMAEWTILRFSPHYQEMIDMFRALPPEDGLLCPRRFDTVTHKSGKDVLVSRDGYAVDVDGMEFDYWYDENTHTGFLVDPATGIAVESIKIRRKDDRDVAGKLVSKFRRLGLRAWADLNTTDAYLESVADFRGLQDQNGGVRA